MEETYSINHNSTSSTITCSQNEQSQVGHIKGLSSKGITCWDITKIVSLVWGDWSKGPQSGNPKLG